MNVFGDAHFIDVCMLGANSHWMILIFNFLGRVGWFHEHTRLNHVYFMIPGQNPGEKTSKNTEFENPEFVGIRDSNC